MARNDRSQIARIRCGVFPLKTGKVCYRGVPADKDFVKCVTYA